MWRIIADGEFGHVNRNFKERRNPLVHLNDVEFFERYRFPKNVTEDLINTLRPTLERRTNR